MSSFKGEFFIFKQTKILCNSQKSLRKVRRVFSGLLIFFVISVFQHTHLLPSRNVPKSKVLSRIFFDTSSLERIYLSPEEILRDPDKFWNEDKAYIFTKDWHEDVNIPAPLEEWKASLQKLAKLSATERIQNPYFKLVQEVKAKEEDFNKRALPYIYSFLPEKPHFDLSTTVFFTALTKAYAFMAEGNIVINVSSPFWRGSSQLILNLLVHEVFHIGYGYNREHRTEKELPDKCYNILDSLQNEGIAVYLAYAARNLFPSPLIEDYAMLEREQDITRLREALNVLFTKAKSLSIEELNRQSWDVGVIKRAYYVVGADMARIIHYVLGREALVETIAQGPASFVQTYNKLVSEGKQIFKFELVSVE